jgi:hypothetical protein
MIEKRALEIAEKIVLKTSHTLALEDQENQPERIKKATKDCAQKIKFGVRMHRAVSLIATISTTRTLKPYLLQQTIVLVRSYYFLVQPSIN